jgi:mRNA interferase YafQ
MYKVEFSPSFIKGYKRCKKKHWDVTALHQAITVIAKSDTEPIVATYNDHKLKGEYRECREVHIGGKSSDWLMVYKIENGAVKIVATGTHDEIF